MTGTGTKMLTIIRNVIEKLNDGLKLVESKLSISTQKADNI